MNSFNMESACDPWGLLAAKIVQQAVMDWRMITMGKNPGDRGTVEEIREFLEGRWCEDLLSITGLDGEWVLGMMETELKKRGMHRLVTVDGQEASICAWCRKLGIDNGPVYKWYQRGGRAYAEKRLEQIKRERGL